MNRKTALEVIRVECARHGSITQIAMRTYCENRLAYKAFTEAAQKGIQQYKEANKDDAQH